MKVKIKTFNAMTTRCEVQLYDTSPVLCEMVFETIEKEVTRLEKKYNFHHPQSWLNQQINQRQSDMVLLDRETAEILAIVLKHSHRTRGIFDISVGTYHQALIKADSQQAVKIIYEQYRGSTGLDTWRLENNQLQFIYPQTRFDLGGVIKEYAVDCAVGIAKQHGISAGLMNFGGDLRCWGIKPDGQKFTSAINLPNNNHLNSHQKMAFALKLHNHALTTSGHYERAVTLKDGLLSHIRSQQRWCSQLISATVVSPTTLISGIYSTALLIDDSIQLPANSYAYGIDGNHQIIQIN